MLYTWVSFTIDYLRFGLARQPMATLHKCCTFWCKNWKKIFSQPVNFKTKPSSWNLNRSFTQKESDAKCKFLNIKLNFCTSMLKVISNYDYLLILNWIKSLKINILNWMRSCLLFTLMLFSPCFYFLDILIDDNIILLDTIFRRFVMQKVFQKCRFINIQLYSNTPNS